MECTILPLIHATHHHGTLASTHFVIPQRVGGWVSVGDWLHTEEVCPPIDSHPVPADGSAAAGDQTHDYWVASLDYHSTTVVHFHAGHHRRWANLYVSMDRWRDAWLMMMMMMMMFSCTAAAAEVHWSEGWVLLPTHHATRSVPSGCRHVCCQLSQVQPSQLGAHRTLRLHPRRKLLTSMSLSSLAHFTTPTKLVTHTHDHFTTIIRSPWNMQSLYHNRPVWTLQL